MRNATLEKPTSSTNVIKHYAQIHRIKYHKQPRDEMGRITNDIKAIGHAKLHTPQTIIEALSSGQCVMLSNFEIDDTKSFRFISSTGFMLDIDDNHSVTDPLKVLDELKDICCSLFYTFSHGTKGNRYRLFFQLDKPITDRNELKILIEYVIHHLQQKGLPVDSAASSPTQVIRGGNKGYEVNSFDTTLKVNQWLPRAKALAEIKHAEIEKKRKEREQLLKNELLEPATFEELKEMCEKIGYIASGEGEEETNKWKQIIYGIKNEVINGNLSDEEGEELYTIISGPEAQSRQWTSMKPYGLAKIGSLIFHAKNAGFKRKHKYSYALKETLETIPVEEIKTKGYLTTEITKQLIQRNQRILVDSSTGTGKTTSFINTFKELANKEFHYYIFAAPTISLTEQIGKEHGITYITGGMKNLKNMITDKAISVTKPERIFVCTFDKTAEIMSYLSKYISYGQGNEPTFTVVIDEVHKFTEAYNYRYAAIDQLEEVSKMATSVIGLSGTVEDIWKEKFDVKIKIETGKNKSPCLDFRVFTYHTRNGHKNGQAVNEKGKDTNQHLADVMLIPVINGLLKQTRVLVFLNNKERIKTIAKILRKDGIRVQTVTSDSKKSSTYVNIVENRAIDDDVQVILTTTVIADGISIKNGLDWSCLIVADKASPIFNPSTIKQISNRFRENYRYFCLYIRELNPDYSETKPFQIESDFVYRKRMVESYVDYLNTEFVDEQLQEFSPSKVEKNNGIFYKSTEENAVIEFNPLFVRHQSMKRKEMYYSAFRQAFINEVSRQIGVKCSTILNVNDEAAKHNQDMSGLLAELEAEHEEKKREDKDLRKGFSQYFTESIYGCFVRDDEEALKLFKEDVHPSQYRALTRLCKIAEYETCKRVCENIKKDADTHKYYNDIQSLVEIAEFEYTNKVHVTKKVYKELSKLTGIAHTSQDFKDITQRLIPKKMKVKPEDIIAALKLFHKDHSKAAGERCTTIRPLSIELIANLRHSRIDDSKVITLDEIAVKNSVIRYVYSRHENQQSKLLAAIDEKYGIEKYVNGSQKKDV